MFTKLRTLLTPSGSGPFPLVVIIAGSGPTDRDGNSKVLAGREPRTCEAQTMTRSVRWYLRLLAGLTIISCIGQLGLSARLGGASAWGVAAGWQREIAFWDLAMYVVIARTLRAEDPGAGRTVAIALVVLQLLVGTNHLVAALQYHSMLNAIMAPVNFGCALFGFFALYVAPHRDAARPLA